MSTTSFWSSCWMTLARGRRGRSAQKAQRKRGQRTFSSACVSSHGVQVPALRPIRRSTRGTQAAPISGGIANPRAGGIFAVLVSQSSRQDEYFLASATIQRGQFRAGVESLDRHVLAVVAVD